MKNNNTKMGTQIIKQGDFVLKHFDYHDSYFLFYKTCVVWEYKFNELFGTQLIDLVFKLEPDRNNAAEFIVKLYNWISSQEEAFEKLLDEVYGEEKQKILDEVYGEEIKILDEFHEEKQKILDEFHEEKQKILNEFHEEKQKILNEFHEEKQKILNEFHEAHKQSKDIK